MKILPHFTPNTPGVFAGVPMPVYQSAPGLSKSRIEILRRSPLDYARTACGELTRETTEALEVGTVFHSLLFEGLREYVVRPDTYEAPESAKKDAPLIAKPWNGNANACKLWLAQHAGQTVLDRYEAAEIERSVDYIKAHPLAGPILRRPGLAELSLFAYLSPYGVLLKGRADWLWRNEDGSVSIADLKTTKDASTKAFSRDLYFRAYHLQAAMYRLILRLLGYELRDWLFIAFEKGAAPKCNVRRLAVEAIDRGEEELEEAFSLYTRCLEAGDWPDFADSSRELEVIDLPSFAYSDVAALEGMTEAPEVSA